MARLSRRLWGGTSLKTAAKEAKPARARLERLFSCEEDQNKMTETSNLDRAFSPVCSNLVISPLNLFQIKRFYILSRKKGICSSIYRRDKVNLLFTKLFLSRVFDN